MALGVGLGSSGAVTSGCSGAESEGDEGLTVEHFSLLVTSMAGLLELAADARASGGGFGGFYCFASTP
jgi:hypothetical protein